MRSDQAVRALDTWDRAWGMLAGAAERHPRLVMRAMRALVKSAARIGGSGVKHGTWKAARPLLMMLDPHLRAAGVSCLAPPSERRTFDEAIDTVAPLFAAAAQAARLRRESHDARHAAWLAHGGTS